MKPPPIEKKMPIEKPPPPFKRPREEMTADEADDDEMKEGKGCFG